MNTVFDISVLRGWVETFLPMLGLFVSVVLLDLLVGVVRAAINGEFSWHKLPDFLLGAAGFLMSWLTAEIVSLLPALWSVELAEWADAVLDISPNGVFAFVLLKFVASVGINLIALRDRKKVNL